MEVLVRVCHSSVCHSSIMATMLTVWLRVVPYWWETLWTAWQTVHDEQACQQPPLASARTPLASSGSL